jgi:hypothetical protein
MARPDLRAALTSNEFPVNCRRPPRMQDPGSFFWHRFIFSIVFRGVDELMEIDRTPSL